MAWMLFDLIEVDLVKLSPVALKSAAGAVGGGVAGVLFRKLKGWIMPENNQLCKIEGCFRKAGMRELCLVCYGKAKKMVENGEVTWTRLEEMGLCGPDTHSHPFDRAFTKAKDKEKEGLPPF